MRCGPYPNAFLQGSFQHFATVLRDTPCASAPCARVSPVSTRMATKFRPNSFNFVCRELRRGSFFRSWCLQRPPTSGPS